MVEIASVVHSVFSRMPKKVGMELHPLSESDEDRYFYITIGDRNYIFQDNRNFLDSPYVVNQIADKQSDYRLVRCCDFFQKAVRVPKTVCYEIALSDNCDGKDVCYFPDLKAVVHDVKQKFGMPVFLKPNNGNMGRDCFYVGDEEALMKAVSIIMSDSDRPKDDLIAQEVIDIKREYRAMMFKGKVVSVFGRMFKERGIHLGDGQGIESDDLKHCVPTEFLDGGSEKFKVIQKASEALAAKADLIYFASDFAEDVDGNLWFVETHSSPMLHLMHSGKGKQDMERLAHAILDHIRCDY